MNHQKHESGNIISFILLAIVLFAALSYVVSDMMRGGSNADKIGRDKAKLEAGVILDYARTMRQAIQGLRISGTCEAEQVSFARETRDGYAHSPRSADACQLFKAGTGGGVPYTKPAKGTIITADRPPKLWGEWYFPNGVCVPRAGDGGAECDSDQIDNEELIAILPYVTKMICEEVNNHIGKSNPNDRPPIEKGHAWSPSLHKFDGRFIEEEKLDQQGMVGCFEGSASNTPPAGTYHVYQVLVPR